MLTANECRSMASTCTKWAADSEAAEARKAFLALARDWQYAAIVADRYAESEPISEPVLSYRSLSESSRCGAA
jgi:hypothetical protein